MNNIHFSPCNPFMSKGDATMDRPYTICHMLSSIDGKIIGDFLEDDRSTYFIKEYERIHDRYECNAWMCGRVTMQEHFAHEYIPPPNQEKQSPIPRTDYVAQQDIGTYAIAVDPHGKLAWTHNYISEENGNRTKDHIIEVLTEQVPDAYLAYLQELGISYIFGGTKELNVVTVVKKLKALFSIDRLLLEGGGVLNGSFLNEGLIDELSLVFVPFAEASSPALTIFEKGSSSKETFPVHFELIRVEQMEHNGLWMTYRVEGNSK
ncbi:RibD family protein [Paenibacillus tundrae]|nr:RibD family protein [Paenibacillus tundrae]